MILTHCTKHRVTLTTSTQITLLMKCLRSCKCASWSTVIISQLCVVDDFFLSLSMILTESINKRFCGLLLVYTFYLLHHARHVRIQCHVFNFEKKSVCKQVETTHRRKRGNLIEAFKILNKFDNVDSNVSFKLSSTGLTGHDYKLFKQPCRLNN